MKYGREVLNFDELLAITTIDNEVSEKLLLKLGFVFQQINETPQGEKLKLFLVDLQEKER
jgi:RimJ/RimL family protein N-acetyltransferase